MMKGQSSMAVIVIAVVLIVFLAMFLLTTTDTSGNADAKLEYKKLFATNTLLSILNTETPDCGSMSDMLKAASNFGGGKCADTEFGERIEGYVDFLLLSSGHTDYDWQIVASPNNFDGTEYTWGKDGLKDKENARGRWDARTMLTSGGSIIDVKIYMKTK
jgi:hypothetical protein